MTFVEHGRKFVVPRVIEYDDFIELASTDKRIYVAGGEPGYLTVGVEWDNMELETEQYEISLPAIDVIRFFDEVIKKFDGT